MYDNTIMLKYQALALKSNFFTPSLNQVRHKLRQEPIPVMDFSVHHAIVEMHNHAEVDILPEEGDLASADARTTLASLDQRRQKR